jgi:hypothetical protein
MVAGSVSGLRTENSIAQTSVSHVSLRGDDAPADSLHWLMSVLGQKQTFRAVNRDVCFISTSDSRCGDMSTKSGSALIQLLVGSKHINYQK